MQQLTGSWTGLPPFHYRHFWMKVSGPLSLIVINYERGFGESLFRQPLLVRENLGSKVAVCTEQWLEH